MASFWDMWKAAEKPKHVSWQFFISSKPCEKWIWKAPWNSGFHWKNKNREMLHEIINVLLWLFKKQWAVLVKDTWEVVSKGQNTFSVIRGGHFFFHSFKAQSSSSGRSTCPCSSCQYYLVLIWKLHVCGRSHSFLHPFRLELWFENTENRRRWKDLPHLGKHYTEVSDVLALSHTFHK